MTYEDYKPPSVSNDDVGDFSGMRNYLKKAETYLLKKDEEARDDKIINRLSVTAICIFSLLLFFIVVV